MCDDAIGPGIFCCGTLVAIVIMIACSFKQIDTNEVGIRENKFYGYVNINDLDNKELYESGNHFVTIWGRFSKISKTQQNAEYVVTANTVDIITVTVAISIQYQIVPDFDTAYDVTYKYDDMPGYFHATVEDAIRIGCQSLESSTFYNDRQTVTDMVRENVGQAITDIGYNLVNLQVTDIGVPQEMENAIVGLVSATQDIEIAENERNKDTTYASNEKAQSIHKATVNGKQKNETALANYNAAVELIDADLYAKRKDIEMLEVLISAYKQQFSNGTDSQIMELVKASRYNEMMVNIASSGSSKVYVDHKPNAIGEISDEIGLRFTGAK